jgi:adenylate cyclase
MLGAIISVLRGAPADVAGPTVVRITRAATVSVILVANAVGASLTILLLTLVLPAPDEATDSASLLRNAIGIGTVVPLVFLLGARAGLRAGTRASRWLVDDRAPDDRERRAVLKLPLRVFWIQARMWGVATVAFVGLNVPAGALFAFEVGITIVMSGLATAAVGYLFTVRTSRALVARALAHRAPAPRETSGVRVRALLTWALATGIPVTGALVLSAIAIGLDEVGKAELGRSIVVLAGISLAVGLLATALFARSVSDPLRALRDALARVEEGDLDVAVAVNDATEVGSVQAGFNQMVAGLRERERVRDLFGRHVGEDVAHRALENGVELGGEEREAAALFVDIVGSTTIATERSPTASTRSSRSSSTSPTPTAGS